MKAYALRLTLLLLFLSSECVRQPVEIKYLIPEATDGITFFQMNHIGQQTSFFGKWSAPQLRKNRKFFRFLKTSGSGVVFDILKKENIIVEVNLNEEVSNLNIMVNDRTFPVSGQRFRKFIPSKNLNAGTNTLNFILQSPGKIAVQQIKIYPARLQNLKGKFNTESCYLTPVNLQYCLNPLEGSKLQLSFSFHDRKPIDAKIIIESEKNKKQYSQSIIDKKRFHISMLDQSMHHVEIKIPEIRSGYIQLKESQLIQPKEKSVQFKDLQAAFKRRNILIILLDAARPDHMSCYGYHRKTTPHIDVLAEKSFKFKNLTAEAAYTLASIGTLLTGLPPDFHGVTSAFFTTLKKEIITFPMLLQQKGYYTGAISSNPYFGKTFNYHKGFDQFHELFNKKKVVMGNDFIIPFEKMVNNAKDKPFFIFLHIREPHYPYTMPKPFFGRYQRKFEVPSEKFDKESSSIYLGHSRNPEDFQFLTDIYDENLAFADHIVGKILDILKRKQIFNSTITIITSDHGEALGEHNLVGHNVVLYKEGINIPLILHIPGEKIKTQSYDNPAIMSDISVTLCSLLDIDYPYPELTKGCNLFSLPTKRTRICRSMVLSNKYSAYMVDSFPYQSIIFPEESKTEIKIFNIAVDPGAKQPLTNNELPRKALMFFLNTFLRRAANDIRIGEKPKLKKKEIETLKSLGYVKK